MAARLAAFGKQCVRTTRIRIYAPQTDCYLCRRPSAGSRSLAPLHGTVCGCLAHDVPFRREALSHQLRDIVRVAMAAWPRCPGRRPGVQRTWLQPACGRHGRHRLVCNRSGRAHGRHRGLIAAWRQVFVEAGRAMPDSNLEHMLRDTHVPVPPSRHASSWFDSAGPWRGSRIAVALMSRAPPPLPAGVSPGLGRRR